MERLKGLFRLLSTGTRVREGAANASPYVLEGPLEGGGPFLEGLVAADFLFRPFEVGKQAKIPALKAKLFFVMRQGDFIHGDSLL